LIFGFVDEQHAAGRGVESICAALTQWGLPFTPCSYRAWRTRPPSARALTDAELIDLLLALQTHRASQLAGTGDPSRATDDDRLAQPDDGRRRPTADLQAHRAAPHAAAEGT